jgi:hypothetical protein
MDTRFWGPSGWRLLHLISFAAAQDDGLPERELHTFFKHLPFVLPCKFCRASLTDYYAMDPIPKERREFPQWLFRIHNRVNGKLRDQNLLETQDPKWLEIKKRYTDQLKASCTKRRMVGWDFLFSVAYTTPCPAVKSSPIAGAPPKEALTTPELRNRWSVITREERLPYIRTWWDVLPAVLPFKEWRDAWTKHVPKTPSLETGRRAITAWLYKAEQSLCSALAADMPHDSFTGLCSELNTFSSGCGARNKRVKTCRAQKSHARKTLKQRRKSKFKATGGYL